MDSNSVRCSNCSASSLSLTRDGLQMRTTISSESSCWRSARPLTSHAYATVCVLHSQSVGFFLTIFQVTRIGWDMDPFVVVSFGKKVFRTRVIRHCLDPEWNEKLLFHVHRYVVIIVPARCQSDPRVLYRYETKFNVKFSVLDWDKISTHDKVGEAAFNVGDLIREEQKDERGIYQGDTLDGDEVRLFMFPRSHQGSWFCRKRRI